MTIFLPVIHCNMGFKKHSGCTHALFTVDETVKYFTKEDQKSTVPFLVPQRHLIKFCTMVYSRNC